MQLLLLISKVKKTKRLLTKLVVTCFLGIAITSYFTWKLLTPKSDISSLIAYVKSENLTFEIKGNGIVKAVQKINLSPKESGKIAKLYVDEGDKVKQGQLIAQMDKEQFQAEVNQYKAALKKAEADLSQRRTGNRPQEIAKAEAEKSKNQAQVTEARSRLALANQQVKRKRYATQQGAIARDELDQSLTEERNATDNLKAAEAGLSVAQQELALQRQGYRKEEIAQSEASVAQAAAQLRFYQTKLENTFVRAPFAGIITRRFAQEGDFVTPTTSASASDGATSTSIAELSSGLEVEAKVPEASISQIKLNQKVEISSNAYPDEIFRGSVRLIAPTAIRENQQNSSVTFFRVKVNLQTGQDKLKPGMNLNLSFKGDSVANVLVVPLAAIITKNDGQTGVLVPNKDNQAEFSSVKLGSISGDKIQIVEGISEGERIFIKPPENQVIPGVDTLIF